MGGSVSSKTNRATKLKRTETIESLLVMGFTRADIILFASEKAQPPWDVSDRTITNYIAAANKNLEKAAETHSEKEMGILLRRLEDLYRRTLGIQDYKAALAVLKERSETLGLKKQSGLGATDVRIHVTHRPDNWNPDDPDQADNRVVFGRTPDGSDRAYSEAEDRHDG